MRFTKPSPLLLASAVSAVFLLLLFLGLLSSVDSTSRWSSSLSGGQAAIQHAAEHSTSSLSSKAKKGDEEVERAANRTLGFGKVLVIGLKERSDKRDAMVLTSSLTGFDVEFMDAMKGEDVSDKAQPPYMYTYISTLWLLTPTCYPYLSVLESDLSSVLIMEDDMDWDIRLPSQMRDFAKGVRTISDTPLTEPQASPYGDAWDILWPGHCGEAKTDDPLPLQPTDPLYITHDDPTVAPKAHLGFLHLLRDYPDGTRIPARRAEAARDPGAAGVVEPRVRLAAGVCVPAAASWAAVCFGGAHAVPPHRSAGAVDRDSDIKSSAATVGEGEDLVQGVRMKGLTANIVWSARLNVVQMITGSENYTMQW
ncbi:hypothetical protein LARI1_G007396 [Lachnellula arida]|uniref:Procollagen galactosyltransferase 1 n=1 Tax=Lachnellula arida TaxID=1316785 RepID=A0A8T9B381_9HELO|nr:hypothetical protein LARI1_G007396 [Lachnellula arida]